MKKLLFMSAILLVIASNFNTVSAEKRINIGNGLVLVDGGSYFVIDDQKNQQTLSLSVYQEHLDQQRGEMIYSVACGRFTKKVVKSGLKTAIAAGVKAAAVTSGASLIESAAAMIAEEVYDSACDYYAKDYDRSRY